MVKGEVFSSFCGHTLASRSRDIQGIPIGKAVSYREQGSQ